MRAEAEGEPPTPGDARGYVVEPQEGLGSPSPPLERFLAEFRGTVDREANSKAVVGSEQPTRSPFGECPFRPPVAFRKTFPEFVDEPLTNGDRGIFSGPGA